MSERRVIVIGGGVIGASCAYYLSQAGWQVTIVDKGQFGKGCSHGNCGLITPSHVLPLPGPGAVREALKAMFRRNSPFKIRLRFDWSLWSWLWRFARRCNTNDMLAAGGGIQAILNSSRTLYDELMTREPFDCEWETHGLLFVLQTAAGMDHFAHTDELLRQHFAAPAIRYDDGALTDLEPALTPGLAGGWHYTTDAQLRPDKLMSSWRQILTARGVSIRENCTASQFVAEHGRAGRVVTSQGELAADAFVVAAGALTPQLNQALGCKIPIQPGKGYSITMARPKRCPKIPMIFEEHRVAVTPLQSGYRLGSTMEFAGYDATLNPRRLALLTEGAQPYLHEPCGEPIEEEWCGWRPMTPDSLPIIDRSPLLDNVMIAAGHNMLGVSMAPATGCLVAELLDGRPPHIDAAAYSVKRF